MTVHVQVWLIEVRALCEFTAAVHLTILEISDVTDGLVTAREFALAIRVLEYRESLRRFKKFTICFENTYGRKRDQTVDR